MWPYQTNCALLVTKEIISKQRKYLQITSNIVNQYLSTTYVDINNKKVVHESSYTIQWIYTLAVQCTTHDQYF